MEGPGYVIGFECGLGKTLDVSNRRSRSRCGSLPDRRADGQVAHLDRPRGRRTCVLSRAADGPGKSAARADAAAAVDADARGALPRQPHRTRPGFALVPLGVARI